LTPVNPHIELSDVTFGYGDGLVLNHVSAAFARGRTTAILGRSQSGKSSLLQLVLGLISPGSGEILVDGIPRTYPLSAKDRFQFGYVIQGNGLFPHLTVSENISLPGRMANVPSAISGARVRHLLRLTSLPAACQGKFPYQLSRGEQMRVLICRAYFPDPPVLLMDEPFRFLRVDERKQLQLEFLAFQRRYPRTVLLVTHDLAEAKMLADDILVLDHGYVQQAGPSQSVLFQPANIEVKHVLQAALGS
jgi:osmoprotectant transport system ATP-binding protein